LRGSGSETRSPEASLVDRYPIDLGAIAAEGMHTRGLVEDGLAILDKARDRVQETAERYFEAEIHRTRGALLLTRRDANIVEAAASYRRAIEIGHMQGARSLELRASASRARLWRHQNKRAEARDLLAPIYG